MSDPWEENDITINGHKLTVGEAMTFRVAVTHFHKWIVNEGLGDDEHGKAMAEGYRHNCENMFWKMGITERRDK